MVELKKIQEKLPPRFNLPQKIADSLNSKGLRTHYDKEYNYHNVRACFMQNGNDTNIINEALDILESYNADKLKTAKRVKKVIAN